MQSLTIQFYPGELHFRPRLVRLFVELEPPEKYWLRACKVEILVNVDS